PIAAASMAMGSYLHGTYAIFNPEIVAIITLLTITSIHSFTIDLAGRWQTVVTILKLTLIAIFVVAGLTMTGSSANNFTSSTKEFLWGDIFSAPYAVALVWVMFAYSGWNSATYILGDIKNPRRTIAPALLISTAIVTGLYLLLNFIFLYVAPTSELSGQIEIGNIAAIHIFGINGGRIMSGIISVLLISSISSMVYVGARVMQPMGQDTALLRPLARTNRSGVPTLALWVQCTIALGFILTASFSQIIIYSGFVLNLCTMLAALGLFINRIKHPHLERPFRAWGYPVLPAIFLLAMLWILVFLIVKQPVESLYGAGTALMGIVLYFVNKLTPKK
ncbi:MAG: amino acid permease, partial [Mucinivorans sp.]